MEYIVLLAALCSDLMHRNEQFFFIYIQWQTRVLNQVPSVHSCESYLYAIWTEDKWYHWIYILDFFATVLIEKIYLLGVVLNPEHHHW